ncbi:hypothetical protein B9Z19DRAFT_1194934 [Tuber borchii]|uniref:Protein kinase domain-containing protein n=1 Tax=Tuber borchii TaxID=42251 RepID=A0A2T6ZL05_TUBBO|nr:hypothetical protein B9Z19DRAFT_1194934 [Tuber borchii]
MSPFQVKLGDFGISKRIRPHDAAAFHTQVSTRIYGALEVLGLDSTSKTSVYTNAADLWSLGCVIYELLVGTQLFASETQLSRYFFGISPSPEDKLKGPTAAGSLGNAWLAGLKSDDENSGDDQDEVTQKAKGIRLSYQDDSKCAPGDVALETNPRPQWGSDPTARKSEIDTAIHGGS